MSNSDEIRWRQRMENFTKALAQLDAACGKTEYTDLERAGLVQTFEFSFELAWKTLKDLLFYEGFDPKTPREVIRKSFEAGYLNEDDTETLLDALDQRNWLSHTYQETIAREAEQRITQSYAPVLRRIHENLKPRQAQ